MAKERTLSTGKTPLGGLPMNSVVKKQGVQLEGDLGEKLALEAVISPYIGLREKWESP